MLFEDRVNETMSAAKEINVSFRCDEAFRDWLYLEAGRMDLKVSEAIRAAVLLAFPQMQSIRGISRIQLEDMRPEEKKP